MDDVTTLTDEYEVIFRRCAAALDEFAASHLAEAVFVQRHRLPFKMLNSAEARRDRRAALLQLSNQLRGLAHSIPQGGAPSVPSPH